MICPVCKTDMIVIEYNEVELDFCTDCKGVWFDSGELEVLLKLNKKDEISSFLEKMQSSPDAVTKEKQRKCPICNSKMNKKNAGDKSSIVIDLCGKGHGLWFDGGEVVQLAEQMSKKDGADESDNAAVEFIKDFFGVFE